MKKVKLTELKKNFSLYLNQVKNGESILLFDRNQPIAQIIPVKKAARRIASDAARLERLERKGLIRRGSGDYAQWLIERRPTKVPGSVLRDLLEERRSGR